MKKLINKMFGKTKKDKVSKREKINERIRTLSSNDIYFVYDFLNTSRNGLTEKEIDIKREDYGNNIVTHGKKVSIIKRIADAFINPFTLVLFLLAVISAFTDIIWAAPGDKDFSTVIIITTMVLISGILRFVQETRSCNAAAKLSEMIRTTACIERAESGKREILMEEIVVGDIVHLSAGDMIPADVRIIQAKDLFVSQSALTGESEPVEKISKEEDQNKELTELKNIAFMGTNVISGSAVAVVVATGDETLLGDMASHLTEKPEKTTFEKGINAVSWVLIRFMLVMVPIVLFVNGFTKGDWMHALLFAISVAVGLTPEMLPMIVTTCLAKGAVSMSKEKVIIKNLNAIQNLGSIDILCTDKTGTLTQDKVVLEYHLDIHGNSDDRVLRHAFLNSFYQTGLKNLIDISIIERTEEVMGINTLNELEQSYIKVDEIPFDFERRRMSVVVSDKTGKTQMITKGAIEEMLKISDHVEFDGKVIPLTEEMKEVVLKKVDSLNDDGMRVLGVAQKNNPSPVGAFSTKDEKNMVLIGYLAFLDPPKKTTADAIKALKEYGVDVKVLTGDNEKVTKCICRQVGLDQTSILMGAEIENMNDKELMEKALKTTIFAKLSPLQKSRVVNVLKDAGHSVGYMGDGINDAAAMKASDVGISVDTAVDIAKESADVILLEKDLMVLEQGIIEGRKTYANMIKYIKMTASSNFGNMFSVLAASAFLPFLPMESIHLILLNLIYDISCTAIPWDNVDKEFLLKPRKWDATSISKFMIWIGPTSSVFDIVTYMVMYFFICPLVCGGAYHTLDASGKLMFIGLFQAGWFVESMWTQTLVIHMIRTPKIPFIQSNASLPVKFFTFLGIAVLTSIPFTKLGAELGLVPLPYIYFAILAVIVLSYMFLVTVVKKIYIRRYGEFL